jgi:branched-chain amino acid transport system substrate-binding protein
MKITLNYLTRHVTTAMICLAALIVFVAGAAAQSGQPITIGYSISMTGGLAANGKSALLAQKIWEEDVNAKGGLLGRPVKLVYYDDQSSAATVPGIYTKLLDFDKVDLISGSYGTALIAPAMPIMIQRKKLMIGLAGLAVNSDFNYPNYFSMLPAGPDPKPAFTKGFFDAAMTQNPKPQTVAIIAADQEFSINAAEGARANAKKAGLTIVYDKTYPPATTDFSPIVRAVQATNPDLVVIGAYPPDAVGMVRAVDEVGFKPKMIGGAMVGLQSTAIKMQLGPVLNGWVNYDYWEPFPKLIAPGVEEFLKKYQARAQAEGVDPLGYYMGPWGYAQLQVLQQAVSATKSLDHKKLADYIRSNTIKTVLGDIKFGAKGEWAESRMLTVQYHSIKGKDLEQFRTMGTQILLAPEAYSTGKVIYPFAKARD